MTEAQHPPDLPIRPPAGLPAQGTEALAAVGAWHLRAQLLHAAAKPCICMRVMPACACPQAMVPAPLPLFPCPSVYCFSGLSTIIGNFSMFVFNFLLYTTTPRIAAAVSRKDMDAVSAITAQVGPSCTSSCPSAQPRLPLAAHAHPVHVHLLPPCVHLPSFAWAVRSPALALPSHLDRGPWWFCSCSQRPPFLRPPARPPDPARPLCPRSRCGWRQLLGWA